MNTRQWSLLHIFIFVISLGLCVRAATTIVDLWHRRDIMRVRQQELDAKKSENAKMEAQLKDIQGDAYVEKIARDTLGLVKDGEAIVLLPNRASGIENREKEGDVPNWRKWWELFF